MALRATSPDGREWTVTVSRFRPPPWRELDYDPWEDANDLFTTAIALLVTPIVLLAPLAIALAELPVALVRAAFTSTRWVDAETKWPSNIVITWRTTAGSAGVVAGQVAEQISEGYEHLRPDDAELVSMTKPPGLQDLDA